MEDTSQKKANECEIQHVIEKALENQRQDYFYEAQGLIYYELPVLVSKIFHAAFANYECSTPVIFKEDMRFIEGFIETTEKVFKIAMEGQRKQIEEMLNLHKQ